MTLSAIGDRLRKAGAERVAVVWRGGIWWIQIGCGDAKDGFPHGVHHDVSLEACFMRALEAFEAKS